MTARRFYLFGGDVPTLIPQGVGATTYNPLLPFTGDVLYQNGNLDYHWLYRQLSNPPGGVFAYIWNRIGLGTASAPIPSADQYRAPTLQQNQHTDPIEQGAYPSEWAGLECGFLLGAHGYPSDERRFNVLTRDPTFTTQHRSFGLEIVPQQETRGLVASISQVSGNTIQVALTAPHGATAGSTFTVWMFGFRKQGEIVPDPQLTAKFVATAHATLSNTFTVELPTLWTGGTGIVGTGLAVTPEYKVVAVSNPTGNIVRVQMSKPFPGTAWDSLLYLQQPTGDVWVGDVTGTATDINGMHNVRFNGLKFARVATASTGVSFTSGTSTISLASGTWLRTPAIGEALFVTGSSVSGNNKRVTVVSATSTTIVVSETLTTSAAGPAVTIHTLSMVEWDHGSAVDVSGWNGDGFVFRQDKLHPVFAADCGGQLYMGRISTEVAQFRENATALLTGTYAGDTIGNADSAIIVSYGDSDLGAAVTGSAYLSYCYNAWSQSLADIYRGLQERVAAALASGVLPSEIAVLSLRTRIEQTAEFWTGSYNEFAIFALKSAEAFGVANTPKAAAVIHSDIPAPAGRWPVGVELVELGMRTWETLEAVNRGSVAAAAKVGFPTYVLLGQSQTVSAVPCSATQPQPSYTVGDPDIRGDWYNSDYSAVIRDRGQFIWHAGLKVPQEYAPALNAVTYSDRLKALDPAQAGFESIPPIGSVVGPEVTLLQELRKRHPEGCCLFKLAVGGASLQALGPLQRAFTRSAADLWTDIEDWWGQFRSWCCDNGRVPDVRAVFFDQGEGDATATESYGAALTEFIADIRALLDCGTSSRAPLPFVIGQVQTHDRMSPAWTAALPLIQQAQQQVAGVVPNVGIASMQGLPIDNTGVHRVWHGIVIAGQRLADALEQTTMAQDGFEIDGGSSINPEVSHGASVTGAGSGSSSSIATFGGSGSSSASTSGSEGGSVATTIITGSGAEIARQVIALCDTAIADGLQILSYSINGRTFTRSSLLDILRVRAEYSLILSRLTGGTRRAGAFS